MDVKKKTKKRISIIGGRAVTAETLLHILLNHPSVEVVHVSSSSGMKKRVEEYYPDLQGKLSLSFEAFNIETFAKDTDIFFLCVGHGEGFDITEQIWEKTDALIIDLSANYRLKNPLCYEDWYRFAHPNPKRLQDSAYGLTELNRDEIKTSRLLAIPGCYATSVILAVVPLVTTDIQLEPFMSVVSTSGLSGAGRKALEGVSFPNPDVNLRPYKVGVHQHTPEMEQGINALTEGGYRVLFVPHVGSFRNGILSEIIVETKEDIDIAWLIQHYKNFYKDEAFIEITEDFPSIKGVVGTNKVSIGMRYDPRTGKIIISSAIDNTIKGAAGQAVQCMNLCLGVEETTGLHLCS